MMTVGSWSFVAINTVYDILQVVPVQTARAFVVPDQTMIKENNIYPDQTARVLTIYANNKGPDQIGQGRCCLHI